MQYQHRYVIRVLSPLPTSLRRCRRVTNVPEFFEPFSCLLFAMQVQFGARLQWSTPTDDPLAVAFTFTSDQPLQDVQPIERVIARGAGRLLTLALEYDRSAAPSGPPRSPPVVQPARGNAAHPLRELALTL